MWLCLPTSSPARSSSEEVRVYESPHFPKVEVEGHKETVDAREVEQMIQREARKLREAKEVSAPRTLPPVVLKPGELVDPDSREVDATGPAPSAPTKAQASATAPAPRERVQYFAPGGTLEGIGHRSRGEGAKDVELGLSVGERISAKLMIGVSSTNHEVAFAQVTKDVVSDGQVVLRRGDVLVGQARSDDARLYLDFQRARTGQGERTFRGYAVERDMPGLLARRRESSFEDRSKSGALRGAVGAAGEILGDLAGGSPAGTFARGVTGGVAPEAERAMESDARVALEVSAGKAFEVVVVEALKR
jgi:hypothetical protein